MGKPLRLSVPELAAGICHNTLSVVGLVGMGRDGTPLQSFGTFALQVEDPSQQVSRIWARRNWSVMIGMDVEPLA